MQNPPVFRSGTSVQNILLPDIPRNRQTDTRKFPSFLHGCNPFPWHILSVLLPVHGMYKSRCLPHSLHDVSRNPDALHKWTLADGTPHHPYVPHVLPSIFHRTISAYWYLRLLMQCPDAVPHSLHKDLPYKVFCHPGFQWDICTYHQSLHCW